MSNIIYETEIESGEITSATCEDTGIRLIKNNNGTFRLDCIYDSSSMHSRQTVAKALWELAEFVDSRRVFARKSR